MNDLSVLEKEIVLKEEPQSPIPPSYSLRKPDLNAAYKVPRRIFGGIIAAFAICILGFVIYTTLDLPPLNEIENPQSTLSTQVISDDGVVLDNFFIRENRVNVKLNDVSPYVVDALIATEDARFYDHSGVDYWSIPALIKRNLSGTTSGGSTITMQLSRNLFNAVSKDRTVTRKIKEVIVSAILEKKYTKQEIIEAYLNTVNIYGNAYGIEMAAQRLFSKPARDLTIEESALVVGMLKGQGVYDPIRKPERAKQRRNMVMHLMVKHGFLNPDEVNLDSLKALPVRTSKQTQAHLHGLAPYFRERVKQEVNKWAQENKKPNGKPYNLYTDGLKIYTTLDSRMQQHAEFAVREHLTKLQSDFNKHLKGNEPYKYSPEILEDMIKASPRYLAAVKAKKSEKEIKAEFDKPIKMKLFSWGGDVDTTISPLDSIKFMCRFLETGFVSIDPASGYVKAWVGGIDFRHFKYDHVSIGKRQVGSTFKPFVYGAAIEAGYKPCDVELNQPVTFEDTDGKGTPWTPKNANGKYGGKMTLRTALATSTNLVTARLMHTVRPQTVVDFAEKIGIQSKIEAVYAICLGATDLSVLELTGAYGTFVNKGVSIEPIYITRIEDSKGTVLVEFPQNSQKALSPQNAHAVIELLKGVVDEPSGTANKLRTDYDFTNEIGAKTGTTQNHSDGWFMGVTPQLVSGVWVGCADRRIRFRDIKQGQGANMAMPIWAIYMKRLYEDEELDLTPKRFSRPRGFYTNFDCGEDAETQRTGEMMVQEERIPKSSDDFDSFD